MKRETNKRIENKNTGTTSLSLEKKIKDILKNARKNEDAEKNKDIIPSVIFCLSIPAMMMAYLYIFRNKNRR